MDWRIRKVLWLMQTEIARPLSVTALARMVNLSPSRFSHLFRVAVGQSPAQYLHDLRLDCALILLSGSALSIKEVMGSIGVNDPSHFTRDFAERHGVTPTAFRASAAGCDEETLRERWLSRRISQETAYSANSLGVDGRPMRSIFDVWRDARAKGA